MVYCAIEGHLCESDIITVTDMFVNTVIWWMIIIHSAAGVSLWRCKRLQANVGSWKLSCVVKTLQVSDSET